MTDPKFAIAVVADDKTEKGFQSAERRGAASVKRYGAFNKAEAKAQRDDLAKSSRGVLRTLGRVEQATARALGGRSLTSGLTSRLGAVREAGSAAGEGLAAAASEGGALSGALVGVGAVAGATVGVLAAAGYAAFKLADGWAKGAASIGRTSDIIGVATKELQEFTAAAARAGVDKGTATSAAGGLSQALNDARYGRNGAALAALGKVGVKLQLNSDGTVNVGAMLPAIADAMARQNSSGRRTLARSIGIPDAAIPAFMQGGAALSAEMADSEKTANILTPGQIATGRRIQRKEAIVGEVKDREIARVGQAAAENGEGLLDATVAAARGVAGAALPDMKGVVSRLSAGVENFGGVVKHNFAPAADMVKSGGAAIERASDKMVAAAIDLAVPGADAALVRYSHGVAKVESNNNPNAQAKTSSALGLYQFTKGTWLSVMKAHGAEYGLGWAADQIRLGRSGPVVDDPTMRARILAMRKDPRISTQMNVALAKQNRPAIEKALGHAASAADLYMGNFLGGAGAAHFFREEQAHPDTAAAGVFPREAAANRSIFYDRAGRARSLAEVQQMMASKIEIALKVEGLPAGARVTAASGHAVAISHSPVGHNH